MPAAAAAENSLWLKYLQSTSPDLFQHPRPLRMKEKNSSICADHGRGTTQLNVVVSYLSISVSESAAA